MLDRRRALPHGEANKLNKLTYLTKIGAICQIELTILQCIALAQQAMNTPSGMNFHSHCCNATGKYFFTHFPSFLPSSLAHTCLKIAAASCADLGTSDQAAFTNKLDKNIGFECL